MSRIHEALKRAEQERAASQGNRTDSAPVMDLPPPNRFRCQDTSHVRHTPAGNVSDACQRPGMPTFSSPFTLDTLLARCAQGDWNPDAKTMLFFNAGRECLGTEQFRTLRSRLYQMREKTLAQENCWSPAPCRKKENLSSRRTWRRCWCASMDGACC